MGYDMFIVRKDELPVVEKEHGGHKIDETGWYFRLNIGGMGRYRFAMMHMQMAFPSPSPGQDEWDGPGWESDPEEEGYIAPVLSHHPLGHGIPLHKFGSNDGWHVTEDECRVAVKTWWDYLNGSTYSNPHLPPEVVDTISDPYWFEWIRYLTLASEHGGFQVF